MGSETTLRMPLQDFMRLQSLLGETALVDATGLVSELRMVKSEVIAADVVLGDGVRIPQPDLVNLCGCSIGDQTLIGPFVEIQPDVSIGSRCKISSHSFICTGVTVEDGVFVGHGVTFVNDKHPRATGEDGELISEDQWELMETRVETGASIRLAKPSREAGPGRLVSLRKPLSDDPDNAT